MPDRGVNVFILCTGRSGSLAFTRACGHIVNFTSGHETRNHLLGPARLAYPGNHIEADLRLAWFLGRLDETYGDRAYYVHLTRDPARVAMSWSRRFGVLGGMASAYRDGILVNADHPSRISRLESARDYVETVTANIRLFLKDKSNVMPFTVENAERDFERFWEWIGAEGDRDAAVAEWRVRHDGEDFRRRPKQRVREVALRVLRATFPPS